MISPTEKFSKALFMYIYEINEGINLSEKIIQEDGLMLLLFCNKDAI